ncbi:Swarming motility protein SwrC [Zhongshania aliphaticivorans]|uniref:Swarming motility protein SwrC n=1 Tax=Zhongshania aliphaticivorans TaxID=1470434 RepID=A0A5S9MWV1_9GAMM|nr:efflux RND transporter permease subunit [Zhongshania aliphaticivorans]CAA0081396.1 Swarming motility protein SwrC [Zhongshania aliphaticivorans]CAA0084917.1 Swarming motility protein SwrC [Zhongshania aliphaticivorans]
MNHIIHWFIRNPIAANLLMALIFIGGVSTFGHVDKNFFPERIVNKVQIDVVYPGASPRQSEEQILNRIEDAIRDVNGIDKIESKALENGVSVTVDALADYNTQTLLNDIKAKVNALSELPSDAESPQIYEQQFRSMVISIAISGDISEAELKTLSEHLQRQLLEKAWIPIVELRQPRDYEVSIEVAASTLDEYDLSFTELAQILRRASLNVSAGDIQSVSGDIQIQARMQSYQGRDFANIPVISTATGGQVKLGDIATIKDGFIEDGLYSQFDGLPSLSLDIYVAENADILKTSAAAHNFIEEMQSQLPNGVSLSLWRDQSKEFRGRLNTLINNGFGGLILIFVILLLFLRPMLAFWVCSGIAISLLGAIWLLPTAGISLNMVSLFAFIMILGIVVDDAIIVGESVYSHHSKEGPGAASTYRGTASVSKPVIFAVITTMIFFIPFLNLPPEFAEPYNLGVVVLVALSFSLLDSLFILPAHLAHMKPETPSKNPVLSALEKLRHKVAQGLDYLTQSIYRPILLRCLHYRGITVATFIALFLIVSSLLFGGWLRSSFFPIVPLDLVEARFTLRDGTPFHQAEEFGKRVENAALQLKLDINKQYQKPFIGHIETAIYGETVRVSMELLNVEERPFDTERLKQQWLENSGSIALVRDYIIQSTLAPTAKPIELQISALDTQQLQQLSKKLEQRLAEMSGVYDIRSKLNEALPELRVHLKPMAETLGITAEDVIGQLRQGYYGEEVQRIPRAQEDVKVMLRYPQTERQQLAQLLEHKIRNNTGNDIPLDMVADLEFVDALKEIRHIDGLVATTITAEVEDGFNAKQITSSILTNDAVEWAAIFPGSKVRREGAQESQETFISELFQMGLLSIILIYGLFAIVFRSYWQPLLVLSAIPFGLMGAILGHILFGREISMFSILGVVAVAGVVVNDNLVMLDRINQLLAEKVEIQRAIIQGASDRFRPIILTSLTTFTGMMPIMLEGSIQARFLIPMVLSLAFGVLLATTVTLLFVPALTSIMMSLTKPHKNTETNNSIEVDTRTPS